MNKGVFGSKKKKRKTNGEKEKKVITAEKKSDILEIRYKQDYDIRELHKIVLKKFEEKSQSIPSKKVAIKKLEWIKEHADSHIEKKSADKKIQEIVNEIKEIEEGKLLSEYLDKTSKIIEEYSRYKSVEVNERSFGKKANSGEIKERGREKVSEEIEAKKHLVNKYLIIVKKYIDINIIRATEKITTCSDCKIELVKEHGGLYCGNCHIILSRQTEETSHKDPEKSTAISTKNDYDKGEHIKSAILKLQALHKDRVPISLLESLEQKIQEYGKKKSDITIIFLLTLLKECGYTDYDDIYLIHTKITGKPAFNCSEIQDRLFDKAEKISAGYNDVRPAGRTNYISATYSVWSLLMMEEDKKWHLPKSYFTFTKNRNRLLEYDDIMQKICDLYGWKCPKAVK